VTRYRRTFVARWKRLGPGFGLEPGRYLVWVALDGWWWADQIVGIWPKRAGQHLRIQRAR
jgi:hypothetical protein